MFTTARMSIDNFRTSVRLTGDHWQPGDPSERFDVVWVGMDDWRPAADAELAGRGWRLTGGWEYDTDRDAFVAPITTEVRR